jgi:hypothetical protein
MMQGRSPWVIFLCLVAALSYLTRPASAQGGTLQQRLSRATTLSCTFPVKVTGTWKAAAASADVGAATLKVAFINVKADEGTADAEGPFGDSYISVRYAGDYLHLMQMHSAGPLYTTTVLAKATADGRMMAIHTRHEYTDVRLPGFTSRPEMYLGDCAVSDAR